MACEGDASEKCGGGNRMNVYASGPVLPDGWTASGCYSDSVTARTLLNGPMPIDGDLTVEKCVSYCSAQGYSISGVEFSRECCEFQFFFISLALSPSLPSFLFVCVGAST